MKQIGGAALAFGVILSTACGDITGATGVNGRVNYSLYTHYELDDWNLTEVALVTGHPQLIQTEFTSKGEEQLTGEASEIEHSMDPAAGVDLLDFEGENISDMLVTVEDAGDYTLQSELDGEVYDYIELSFETPDELELITWLRNPGEEAFEQVEAETISVGEGGQVTFLPVPRSGGERLAGDLTVEIATVPESAVVRGENIYGVYEQNVTSSDQPVSLYFVEPGTVTVTIADVPNGVEISQTFSVEGIVEE
jgi:hypothetical protein